MSSLDGLGSLTPTLPTPERTHEEQSTVIAERSLASTAKKTVNDADLGSSFDKSLKKYRLLYQQQMGGEENMPGPVRAQLQDLEFVRDNVENILKNPDQWPNEKNALEVFRRTLEDQTKFDPKNLRRQEDAFVLESAGGTQTNSLVGDPERTPGAPNSGITGTQNSSEQKKYTFSKEDNPVAIIADFASSNPKLSKGFEEVAPIATNEFNNSLKRRVFLPEATAEKESSSKQAKQDMRDLVRNDPQTTTPADKSDLATTSQKLDFTNDFSNAGISSLGIANSAGNIDLSKSVVVSNIPPDLKAYAQPQFQRIAKAGLAMDPNEKQIGEKVDALTRLSNNDRFQEYLSKVLNRDDLTRFNYNTAAAQALNDLNKISTELPQKLKDLIDSKTKKDEASVPLIGKEQKLSNPDDVKATFTKSKANLLNPSASSASTLASAPITSLKQAFEIPKDFGKGTTLSSDSELWIEMARFLTTAEGIRSAVSRGYNASMLSAGRQQLEVMLSELRSQNSLDLVSLLRIPALVDPFQLSAVADQIALKYMREFIDLKPEVKNYDKKSKITLSSDSPYSLGSVQKECADTLSIYTKIAVDTATKSEAILLTKIQLLNALTSKSNVQEVWNFYDPRSFQFMQRAQGNLYMSRYLLGMKSPTNTLSYLYRFTQKELEVRNQLADERSIKENGKRRIPSSLPSTNSP